MSCYLDIDPANNYTATPFPCNNIVWATYLFLILYVIASCSHVALGVYWRQWWTIPTIAAGAAVEAIGWGGRFWSMKSTVWDPNNGGIWDSAYSGFIMQICCLVIAPTFFSAANYILLGRLIRLTGDQFISVTPKSLAILFITADVVCLFVQAAGGGIAGTSNTNSMANTGAYIMTGGVCLQLVVTLIFCFFYFEFVHRYFRNRPSKRQRDLTAVFKCCARRRRPSTTSDVGSSDIDLVKRERGAMVEEAQVPKDSTRTTAVDILTIVMGFTTLLIIIRGVYRSVELTNGWTGPIETNQALFIGMDAFLMVLLVFTYIVFHPGLALGRR